MTTSTGEQDVVDILTTDHHEVLALVAQIPQVDPAQRRDMADTVIGGRYPIKRGEAVTILTGALHRQSQWGDNVELF